MLTSSKRQVASLMHFNFSEVPLKVFLAINAVYFIWGSTYIALHTVREYVPPFLLNGLRFMVAGAVLFVLLRLSGHPMPTRKQWWNAIWIGSLMTGFSSGFLAYAIKYVPSGLAALGIASIPLWAAFFASIWERRPTRAEMAGLLIGFAGVLVLNFSPDIWKNPWGGLALLVSPIMWSFGTILSRHMDMPRGLMNSPSLLLCGGTILTIAGFLRGERIETLPPTNALLYWAYLTIFGSMVAFSAFNYLVQNTQPILATSYAYVNPIVAVILGALVLGEAITPQAIVAGGLILISVAIITTSSRQPKPRVTRAIEDAGVK